MKKYKGFQLTWWILFLQAILMLLSQSILFYFRPYMNQNLFMLICQSVIIIPILIGILSLKINFPYDTISNMTGINGFNITLLIPLLILPLCSNFFISYITAPVNVVIYSIFGEYDPGISSPENLTDFLYILLSLCIVAPFAEEFLFRGIILKLLDRYGTLFSVIVSSVAFSLIHFNPTGFIPVFFIGIILCLLRLGTGSLFAPIFFHISNNFFSFITLIFEKNVSIPENFALIFSICAAALFPVLLFIFFKFYSNKFYFAGTGEKAGFSAGFLITLLIYISVCISTIFFAL